MGNQSIHICLLRTHVTIVTKGWGEGKTAKQQYSQVKGRSALSPVGKGLCVQQSRVALEQDRQKWMLK